MKQIYHIAHFLQSLFFHDIVGDQRKREALWIYRFIFQRILDINSSTRVTCTVVHHPKTGRKCKMIIQKCPRLINMLLVLCCCSEVLLSPCKFLRSSLRDFSIDWGRISTLLKVHCVLVCNHRIVSKCRNTTEFIALFMFHKYLDTFNAIQP